MTTETKKLFEELTASVDNYFNTMNEGLIKVKAFLDKIEQDAATTKKAREAAATELEETNRAMEIASWPCLPPGRCSTPNCRKFLRPEPEV